MIPSTLTQYSELYQTLAVPETQLKVAAAGSKRTALDHIGPFGGNS
jgi:hypothetical protein